jgi:hypothetical protein
MHADENTEHHIEWENKDLPNRFRISVQTKDGLYFLMSLGATDL